MKYPTIVREEAQLISRARIAAESRLLLIPAMFAPRVSREIIVHSLCNMINYGIVVHVAIINSLRLAVN